MTTYRYLRAAEWGMTWKRPPLAERLLDAETYIHHTAGAHVDDAPTAFRNLNAYAQDVKGYSALDYDVLVHYSPSRDLLTIGGGREGYLSAATLDRNEQGEAVCVLGYFQPGHQLSRQPYPAELEGTALAIEWAIDHGWIAASTVILGHRDNPAHPAATSCPGDYLQEKLPWIRQRVAELLETPAPLPPPNESDDTMQTRYFRLKDTPATVWATADGLLAVRLEGSQYSHRGSPAPEVLDRDDPYVQSLVFLAGLPAISVQ